MGSRVRRPEMLVLPLSQSDTITVKKYLTAGEFRELVRASTRTVKIAGGEVTPGELAMELDPTAAALAMVVAYLLDWTFADADGRPIVIRDQPVAVVKSALDLIDADAYMEVQTAIQTHDRIMRETIAEEKKILNGWTSPAPI
jgi:hypothetical protein